QVQRWQVKLAIDHDALCFALDTYTLLGTWGRIFHPCRQLRSGFLWCHARRHTPLYRLHHDLVQILPEVVKIGLDPALINGTRFHFLGHDREVVVMIVIGFIRVPSRQLAADERARREPPVCKNAEGDEATAAIVILCVELVEAVLYLIYRCSDRGTATDDAGTEEHEPQSRYKQQRGDDQSKNSLWIAAREIGGYVQDEITENTAKPCRQRPCLRRVHATCYSGGKDRTTEPCNDAQRNAVDPVSRN